MPDKHASLLSPDFTGLREKGRERRKGGQGVGKRERERDMMRFQLKHGENK